MSSSGYAITTDPSSGTVTSVGLSLPASLFSVSGSPVINAGVLTGTLINQNANKVFAGPTGGADAVPTFRVLVAADIPDLSGTYAKLNADNVFTSTGYQQISAGTTAQRPGSPADGMIRFNSTTGRFEFYNGAWTNYVKLSGDTMTGNLNLPILEVTGSVKLLDTSQKVALDVATATILRIANAFSQASFPSGTAANPGIAFTAAPTYGMSYDAAGTRIQLATAGVARLSISTTVIAFNSSLSFNSANNFAFDAAGSGTKLGTAVNQKIGLWNVTPIVQPTTAIAGATRVGGGGTNLTDTDTFDGYTLAQVVRALKNFGVLQ